VAPEFAELHIVWWVLSEQHFPPLPQPVSLASFTVEVSRVLTHMLCFLRNFRNGGHLRGRGRD
jgi:hypothetical protein